MNMMVVDFVKKQIERNPVERKDGNRDGYEG
jgi:hypothetical protein